MARHPVEWDRFCQFLCTVPELDFSLDISRVQVTTDYIGQMDGRLRCVLRAMAAIESGAVANRDEGRMVGHYWLRSPELAPSPALTNEIRVSQRAVETLAGRIRDGSIAGADGPFLDLIHVGIGGSAVGPQLLCEAWRQGRSRVAVQFLDNADPDGLDRVLDHTRAGMGRTLVSVVSKSGITPTPWHVMLELERAYQRAGFNFSQHAVATSVAGSELDQRAATQNWLARLPLWDWVGGRTSITSAVGLLPAAVLGADVVAFLEGASIMDRQTRADTILQNPAALLALMWYWLGRGHGDKNMVVLPYADRLAGLTRWIQQLVMESVGKRVDRSGKIVHQGLTVYGHKGVSDQHSYLQQLRDGPADFFVTFVRVLRERTDMPAELTPDVTLGDHLFSGLEGARAALYSMGRDSITITVPDTDPRSLGALVALYERAVGLYAELVDVNGYNQPGVDKHIAIPILEVQRTTLNQLRLERNPVSAEQLADAIGKHDQVEIVYKVLDRLANSPGRPVAHVSGTTPRDSQFVFSPAMPPGTDSSS